MMLYVLSFVPVVWPVSAVDTLVSSFNRVGGSYPTTTEPNVSLTIAEVPAPSAPEKPAPSPSPAPQPDPKGPETPDEPISPEPQPRVPGES
jgi:hypothetical protein